MRERFSGQVKRWNETCYFLSEKKATYLPARVSIFAGFEIKLLTNNM